MKRLLLKAALPLLLCWVVPHAQAEPAAFHPNRPVTIIVPSVAGGGTDYVSRLVAQGLQQLWGQPVNIDNRPGGNGVIGTAIVAKAAPDGYTLLCFVGTLAINPFVIEKLPYDTERDLVPITTLASPTAVMIGAPSLPVLSASELIAASRQQPGRFSFGSTEWSSRLLGERFARDAKIRLTHIPYRGGAQLMTDIMGGHVDIGFTSMASAQTQLAGGKVKVLAVDGKQRHPLLPDVPTFAELQLKSFEIAAWFGLFGPRDLPAELANSIQKDIAQVLAQTPVREKLLKSGSTPGGQPPAVFAQQFRAELQANKDLIRELGIKPE